MIFMSWESGKENIKMGNRLLLENDVIKAVDRHTNRYGNLDDDIRCILEELKSPILVGSKEAINNLKV